MAIKARQVFNVIENLAPLSLAESWDNCGLQLGRSSYDVTGICVALDIDEALVDWVIASEANLIVNHHPLFFNSFKNIDLDTGQGRIIEKLICHGISVYSAHTNLDSASHGLNQYLADKLDLKKIKVLGNTKTDVLFKLVVFVPDSHVEKVRKAINEAGAGFIGKYRDCSFRAAGIGTFKPLDGSNPYKGQIGVMEEASEFRLETIVPEGILHNVKAAMLKAHPYEEVAYDIYKLENKGKTYGYARMGELAKPMTLKNFAGRVKKTLNLENIRYVGDPSKMVSNIALASGAGSSMIPMAAAEGCHALITGDLKYHEARDAEAAGLALIDAGHDGLELFMVDLIGDYLEAAAEQGEWDINIYRIKEDSLFKHL